MFSPNFFYISNSVLCCFFVIFIYFLSSLLSLKSIVYDDIFVFIKLRDTDLQQEAHGPRFAHLSDRATADMQMLCSIFPILSSQLIKMHVSSFEQFLVLKKNIRMGLTVNGA